MFAGHVMAFEHVVHVGDGALEFADQLGMADRHADEGGYVFAQAPRVNDGVIAGDDSAIFEFLDPLDHRRRRQAYLFAEFGERGFTMLLEQGQDLEIDRVELRICT